MCNYIGKRTDIEDFVPGCFYTDCNYNLRILLHKIQEINDDGNIFDYTLSGTIYHTSLGEGNCSFESCTPELITGVELWVAMLICSDTTDQNYRDIKFYNTNYFKRLYNYLNLEFFEHHEEPNADMVKSTLKETIGYFNKFNKVIYQTDDLFVSSLVPVYKTFLYEYTDAIVKVMQLLQTLNARISV